MDLYSLFIELALSLTRQNGVSSFIVPDSLIGRSNFETSRKILICDNTILSWLHLNEVFESAKVASIIYVFKKQNTPEYSFEYTKAENVNDWKQGLIETVTIKKSIVEGTEAYKVNFSSDIESELLLKINSNERLSNKLKMWRGEEMGRRSTSIKVVKEHNCLPLLAGDNVHRYEPITCSRYIRKDDVEKDNYDRPKIIIRQLGTFINATLDLDGSVTLQSIYNLVLPNNDVNTLKFILGLLNSKLYNFIYHKASGDKQTFQRIILENIKQLPIPNIVKSEQDKIVKFVNQILHLKQVDIDTNTTEIEKQIDTIVYNLFNLTPDEIELIEQS